MAASLPVGAVVILELDRYVKEGRNADCVDETDDGGRIDDDDGDDGDNNDDL